MKGSAILDSKKRTYISGARGELAITITWRITWRLGNRYLGEHKSNTSYI